MAKIKHFYQGEQLSLFPDSFYLEVSRFAMRDIEPKTVRFSTFQRSTKNFRVGIAIAKSDSGYFRVQYLEDGRLQYAEIPPDRIFPLEQAKVTVQCDQSAVVHDAMAALELERDRLRAGVRSRRSIVGLKRDL